MATNEQSKFYKKPWFCILMLIIFAPVGIVFLWKYKHFSKNISIILTIVSAIFFIFSLATSKENGSPDEDAHIETSAEATKNTATPNVTATPDTTATPNVTATPDTTATPIVTVTPNKKNTKKSNKNTPPKRKNATGKSNKDVSDFGDFYVASARNDVTGKWKVCSIAESKFNVQKYALSYYKKYFKSDDEVHCIVNFTLNTTTCITCHGNFLDVAIHEYVDKEEHDAKILCSGQTLNEYQVYLDNGDIEKIN